jgi:adenine-specific DNA-methyltransferase
VPSTVRTLFDVKQGALPAPRDAFIISESEWEALPERERRWFRRVAENRNIRSGQVLPGAFIFYTKSEGLPYVTAQEVLREECPIFFQRLLHFQPILAGRRGKRDRWWELGEDRKWLRSPSQKIVSAYFGQIGSFAFDVDGDHVVVQGYGWLPRWLRTKQENVLRQQILSAYLCIFNSMLFFQLLSESCPTVGGGQLNLSKRFSEAVPLPDLLTRAEKSVGDDRILMDLAFIGEVITERGLAFAPRSRAEELVEILYGL